MVFKDINFPGYGNLAFNEAGMMDGIVSEIIVDPALVVDGVAPPEAIKYSPGDQLKVIDIKLDEKMASGAAVWVWDGKSPHGDIICFSGIKICTEA